jgi:spermidine/putrescine-binding protein
VNSQDDREIREAAEILRQSNAARCGFAGTELGDLLMSREVALAQAENRKLSPPLETNENLSYSLPNEGAILHVDNLCILATAPPDIKAAAERFINFILEPQMNSRLASYNFAASTLQSARDLLPVGTVGENFMYPQNLDLVPLHLIQPLGEIDGLYAELFEEIKASE